MLGHLWEVVSRVTDSLKPMLRCLTEENSDPAEESLLRRALSTVLSTLLAPEIAVSPWAGHLASPGLSFFICKTGMQVVAPPTSGIARAL